MGPILVKQAVLNLIEHNLMNLKEQTLFYYDMPKEKNGCVFWKYSEKKWNYFFNFLEESGYSENILFFFIFDKFFTVMNATADSSTKWH